MVHYTDVYGGQISFHTCTLLSAFLLFLCVSAGSVTAQTKQAAAEQKKDTITEKCKEESKKTLLVCKDVEEKKKKEECEMNYRMYPVEFNEKTKKGGVKKYDPFCRQGLNLDKVSKEKCTKVCGENGISVVSKETKQELVKNGYTSCGDVGSSKSHTAICREKKEKTPEKK